MGIQRFSMSTSAMLRNSRFAMFFCAALTLAAAPRDAAMAQAQATLARTPLRFEANQGQWDPAVLYAARSAGFDLMFTAHGPALTVAGSRRVDISLPNSNPAAAIEAIGRTAPNPELRARVVQAVAQAGSPRLEQALRQHLPAAP